MSIPLKCLEVKLVEISYRIQSLKTKKWQRTEYVCSQVLMVVSHNIFLVLNFVTLYLSLFLSLIEIGFMISTNLRKTHDNCLERSLLGLSNT